MSVFFIVPGMPTAKGRARMTKTGHAYTPDKTRNYEAWVKTCFASHLPPFNGPVSINIEACFPIPKSWSKNKKALALHHTSRPDLDNVVKAITDALNGLAWVDDSQICQIHAEKRYTDLTPRVSVEITEI